MDEKRGSYEKKIIVEEQDELEGRAQWKGEEVRIIEHADVKILHIMNGYLIEDFEGQVEGVTSGLDDDEVWLNHELLWLVAEKLGMIGSKHDEYRIDIVVRDKNGNLVELDRAHKIKLRDSE